MPPTFPSPCLPRLSGVEEGVENRSSAPVPFTRRTDDDVVSPKRSDESVARQVRGSTVRPDLTYERTFAHTAISSIGGSMFGALAYVLVQPGKPLVRERRVFAGPA